MTGIGVIYIGGSKIAVGVIDESRRVLSRLEVPSSRAESYSKGRELIRLTLREAAQAAGVEIAGIAAAEQV